MWAGRMARIFRHRQPKGSGPATPGLNGPPHNTFGSRGLPGGESRRGPEHAVEAGTSEDVYDTAPRGPHEKAKAGSPEPQSPAVITRPSPPRLSRGPRDQRSRRTTSQGFHPAERPPIRWLKGTNGAPSSCSDVDQVGKAGSPVGREPRGDRALVVVRVRESRTHGEGGQVALVRSGGGPRDAEGRPRDARALESRMRGDMPVRFGERGVETGHGEASEAPADERAGNR